MRQLLIRCIARARWMLLALICAVGVGAFGCKKPVADEESEEVYSVKRFPRLNPKEGLLGRWEWGFTDINYSLSPEYWKLTIPEQEGMQVQFILHADSSWEWQRTGKGAQQLRGPRFTSVHVERVNGYNRKFIFDSLTLINDKDGKEKVFYYKLHDTCMKETDSYVGAIGGSVSVYYLRERE